MKSSKQKKAAIKGSENAGKSTGGGKSTHGIKKQIAKDIVKLDRDMTDYIQDPLLFTEFAQRIDYWYSNTYVQQMYNHLYLGLGTSVNYENFIAGLVDLDAPCNELERHILARLLDPNKTNSIAYSNLEYLLWSGYASKSIDQQNVKGSLLLTSPSVEGEERLSSSSVKYTCGLNEQRWLHIYIKMLKFDRFPEHPGNLEMDFPDNISFDVVALQIIKMTNLPTTHVQLYTGPNITLDNRINLTETFRDRGMIGGPKFSPQEFVIYYDYEIGYIDDPLAMESQI